VEPAAERAHSGFVPRYVVVAAALVVAVCSCGHRRHARETTPAPNIVVRLAVANEFPPRRDWFVSLADGCPQRGQRAPEIVDAVVGFARANLVREIEALTGYPSGTVHVRIEGEGEHQTDGFVSEIVVSPRTAVGELTISQRELYRGNATWGAAVYYCMHVRRTSSAITVVLEEQLRLIG
jgi:hypothetical protein